MSSPKNPTNFSGGSVKSQMLTKEEFEKTRILALEEYRKNTIPNIEIEIGIEFSEQDRKKLENFDNTNFISLAECFIVCYYKLLNLKLENEEDEKNLKGYLSLLQNLEVLSEKIAQYRSAVFEKSLIEEEIRKLINPYLKDIIFLIDFCKEKE